MWPEGQLLNIPDITTVLRSNAHSVGANNGYLLPGSKLRQCAEGGAVSFSLRYPRGGDRTAQAMRSPLAPLGSVR